MGAALGRHHGVDLVEDRQSQAGEQPRRALREQQQVEAFRAW